MTLPYVPPISLCRSFRIPTPPIPSRRPPRDPRWSDVKVSCSPCFYESCSCLVADRTPTILPSTAPKHFFRSSYFLSSIALTASAIPRLRSPSASLRAATEPSVDFPLALRTMRDSLTTVTFLSAPSTSMFGVWSEQRYPYHCHLGIQIENKNCSAFHAFHLQHAFLIDRGAIASAERCSIQSHTSARDLQPGDPARL